MSEYETLFYERPFFIGESKAASIMLHDKIRGSLLERRRLISNIRI